MNGKDAMKYLAVMIASALVMFITACTIKIDNPFYAPSTLDVNKNTSSGAANYLPVKSKQMTQGVSE